MNHLNDITLWTALVTPMDDKGNIDFAQFEKLVRRQEAAGNGLLVLGSTGEALNLDEGESRELLSFTCNLKPKTPIMVGVGGINQKATLEWLKFCETLPIDAYLMVTPLYAKPGPKGQLQWFKTLMDAVSKPVMLYNVPSRTGKPLDRTALKSLEDHPRFWAIKEASGSVSEFQAYTTNTPNKKVFSGEDGLIPQFAPIGCAGLVSVIANVWPKATAEYVRRCLGGKYAGLFPLFQDATDACFRVTNPIPAKVALKSLGVISSATLRPPLVEEELESDAELLAINDRINNWKKENNI